MTFFVAISLLKKKVLILEKDIRGRDCVTKSAKICNILNMNELDTNLAIFVTQE